MFNVGDEVIRKSGRKLTGVVVGLSTSGKYVRVRWHNALRPFSGGYSDNHTNVLTSSVVPATPQNRQKMQAQLEARNAKIKAKHEAFQALHPYCPTCGRGTYYGKCSLCNREEWEQERDARRA